MLEHTQPLSAHSYASFEHIVKNAFEGIVLESRRHSLLVAELFIDLVILGVRSLLHPHVDAVVRRESLLEPDTNGEADHCGEGAVVNGWCQFYQDTSQASRVVSGRRSQMNIG